MKGLLAGVSALLFSTLSIAGPATIGEAVY